MAMTLRCDDLLPGCEEVIEGQDVAEVIRKTARHARLRHGMASMPPEFAAEAEAAIIEPGSESTGQAWWRS
jgi:predicted small metal-binding protein